MRGTHPTKTNLAGTRMKSLNNLITLFQYNKRKSNAVYEENLMIGNEVKGIELLQTMQWSKLHWDDSWEEIIELDSLLPKVGEQYRVQLTENEKSTKDGRAFILWQPPHSELNGWWDKRPSEIFKSYVIEGTLSNRSSVFQTCEILFDFKVTSYKKLIDYFSKINDINASYIPYFLRYDSVLEADWTYSQSPMRYELDGYIYLSVGVSEATLETILSYDNDRLHMHYLANLYHVSNYETIIINYCLNDREQKLFESIVSRATEIIDTSAESLTDNQIHGAQYW